MAERRVEVLAAAPGQLHLRLLGSACEGCSGGCGGRCNLFATGDDGVFVMDAPVGPSPEVGAQLTLRMDDGQLRHGAWRGYGIAWAGMMLGAIAGHVLGTYWLGHPDLLTLAGLLLGTYTAVRLSKRHLPEPQLLAAQADLPSSHASSDCP